MREVYSKDDFREALLSIANDDNKSFVLFNALLYAKLTSIKRNYKWE